MRGRYHDRNSFLREFQSSIAGGGTKGLQVFYRLDDPLVEKLCKLVCATIVQEAREEVEQKRQLLRGWGAKGP